MSDWLVDIQASVEQVNTAGSTYSPRSWHGKVFVEDVEGPVERIDTSRAALAAALRKYADMLERR